MTTLSYMDIKYRVISGFDCTSGFRVAVEDFGRVHRETKCINPCHVRHVYKLKFETSFRPLTTRCRFGAEPWVARKVFDAQYSVSYLHFWLGSIKKFTELLSTVSNKSGVEQETAVLTTAGRRQTTLSRIPRILRDTRNKFHIRNFSFMHIM